MFQSVEGMSDYFKDAFQIVFLVFSQSIYAIDSFLPIEKYLFVIFILYKHVAHYLT
jgi:hypothetical protein